MAYCRLLVPIFEPMHQCSKNIEIYDKFQNGGQVIHLILAKSNSAWPKESVIFKISCPVCGAVPKFGMYPQIMELFKCTKFCFDRFKFCQDIASKLFWVKIVSFTSSYLLNRKGYQNFGQVFLCSSVQWSSEPILVRIQQILKEEQRSYKFKCFCISRCNIINEHFGFVLDQLFSLLHLLILLALDILQFLHVS